MSVGATTALAGKRVGPAIGTRGGRDAQSTREPARQTWPGAYGAGSPLHRWAYADRQRAESGRRDRKDRFESLWLPRPDASRPRNFRTGDHTSRRGRAGIRSWRVGRFGRIVRTVGFRYSLWTADALHRGLAIQLHFQRIAPVALSRQSGEPRSQLVIGFRRRVQLHAERRQPHTRADIGQPRIALVVAL